MGDYRRLKVWHKTRNLRTLVYILTKAFPSEEKYGLKAQMRAAAGSIMANIAEGCGRNRDGELLHFLSIALGSVNELESHLTAALDEGLVEGDLPIQAQQQTAEVKRMLSGFSRRLRDQR